MAHVHRWAPRGVSRLDFTLVEIYPDMPECQGRNRDELEQTLELTALERFKDINLDCLSQVREIQ